jgi:hypothetical protein
MTRTIKGENIKYLKPMARTVACLVAFLIFAAFFTEVETRAQDDQDDAVPPGLKIISKEERTRLDNDKDVKSRTGLALGLLNLRLTAAEKMLSASDFDGLFRELGGFEALLDNHLDFLNRVDNDSGRVLDNFKRFEIGLRAFVPRVETIRRDLPLRFEPFVRSVGKYIRDARARALEPLFSDTVVRQPKRPF